MAAKPPLLALYWDRRGCYNACGGDGDQMTGNGRKRAMSDQLGGERQEVYSNEQMMNLVKDATKSAQRAWLDGAAAVTGSSESRGGIAMSRKVSKD